MTKSVGTPALPQNELKGHEVFDDPKHHIRLYQGNCLELLALIPESSVDLIFADPPYFLSNGGITCHAGRMVSVNKGEWDKSKGPDTESLEKYKSTSQRARISSESWAARELYCPRCESDSLGALTGNTPVLDFRCPACSSGYQKLSHKHLQPRASVK